MNRTGSIEVLLVMTMIEGEEVLLMMTVIGVIEAFLGATRIEGEVILLEITTGVPKDEGVPLENTAELTGGKEVCLQTAAMLI